MEKQQANTFMKLKKNRDLWFMEATGTFEKPYKSKYNDGMLYVWFEKDDDYIEMYDISNPYGEIEDETTMEFFNQL